jgi:hypothetical protein
VAKQTSAEIVKPINTLEQKEDPQGIWSNKINVHINKKYTTLCSKLNHLAMLKVSGFQ